MGRMHESRDDHWELVHLPTSGLQLLLEHVVKESADVQAWHTKFVPSQSSLARCLVSRPSHSSDVHIYTAHALIYAHHRLLLLGTFVENTTTS